MTSYGVEWRKRFHVSHWGQKRLSLSWRGREIGTEEERRDGVGRGRGREREAGEEDDEYQPALYSRSTDDTPCDGESWYSLFFS